jgi:hypothetical protein
MLLFYRAALPLSRKTWRKGERLTRSAGPRGITRMKKAQCKQWTSSSPRYVSVPGDDNRVAEYARREWEKSVEWHFTRGRWDEVNKVALPLKPPDGAEKASWPDIRRVLAVWTPVSQDGQYAFSSIQTQTLSGTSWKPATVEVFSASLYLRNLRHRGETHLTTTFPQVERLLEGLHALFRS